MIAGEPPSSDPTAPRVLLLGAGFSTENRGVAALAAGALTALHRAWPNATVSFLDYARKPETHRFYRGNAIQAIDTVALRFSPNVLLPGSVFRLLAKALGLRLLPPRRRAARLRTDPILRAIAGADLIGALSGGDSFSDLYGWRRLLYVAAPQWLVLLLGRRLVLLPQSYGPFRRRSARLIARSILRRAARVFARDPSGPACVRGLAPRRRHPAVFAYDLGFALEPRPAPTALQRELAYYRRFGPLVGVNPSGLLAGDPTATRVFGLAADHHAALRDLIVAFVRERRVAVALVAHVFGRGGESDLTAARALWRDLPGDVQDRTLLWPEDLDAHEVKDYIGRCDFFLGARMHACIAATSQLVPTLALAYSDKFAGVLASLRAGELVCDLRRHDAAALRRAAEAAFAVRAATRARLRERIPLVHAEVLEFFARLDAPGSRPKAAGRLLQPAGHAA